MDPTLFDVSETTRAIREGVVSAEDCVVSYLARAEIHSNLNAFITLDPDQAIADARAADQKTARGETLRPLHGVPLVLKDNIDTEALPTTGGTPALADHRPGRNAPIAQALIDAGAIVLGKANMHELAFGITNNNAAFGPARNPYDPSMIPGGSSGGTAVAVSAHMAAGGLGTDTGGSVRIPSALCGIVGFRPSSGRYSQNGIVPISRTRDTAGPMVRSVTDAILLDTVITGEAGVPEPIPLGSLRLGIAEQPFFTGLDPDVRTLIKKALERLQREGAELVEFDAPEIGELDEAAGFPIALHETVFALREYLADSGSGVSLEALFEATASPDVHDLLTGLLGDRAIPEEVYHTALHTHRPALQAALARRFEDHQIDALVFPTTPLPARPIGHDETVELNGEQVPTFPTFIRNTDPGSVAGLPGLTLPVGLTENGLPVGIEIDGRAGDDKEVLAIGLSFEAVLDRLPAPLP